MVFMGGECSDEFMKYQSYPKYQTHFHWDVSLRFARRFWGKAPYWNRRVGPTGMRKEAWSARRSAKEGMAIPGPFPIPERKLRHNPDLGVNERREPVEGGGSRESDLRHPPGSSW